MDGQESIEILRTQPNAEKQLSQTRAEVKKGIKILKDYIAKMDRAIEMIASKTPDFDVSDLEDSKDKCAEMISIVVKKQSAIEGKDDAPSSGGERQTSMNKYGLSRDEQRILDNWEEQMKEIVR